MRNLLIALMMSAVALAGCAGDGDDAGPSEEPFTTTTGAIRGLLVDDRFRPIQLVEGADADFQAEGFILLQETGQQVGTNENGEFSFANLNPGQYTLRVAVSGHEAQPTRTDVAEGEFTEVTLEARRVSSEGSFIITTEYSVFVPCGVDAVVVGTVFGCIVDSSGDTYRVGFSSDLQEHTTNITNLMTEIFVNNIGSYTVVVRATGPTSFGGAYYAEAHLRDEQYKKILNVMNETNEEHNYRGNVEWNNTAPFETILFVDGFFADELAGVNDGTLICQNDPGLPDDDVNQLVRDRTCRPFSGIGARAGVQAQFIQSIFLGEPEQDIDAYCVLC